MILLKIKYIGKDNNNMNILFIIMVVYDDFLVFFFVCGLVGIGGFSIGFDEF